MMIYLREPEHIQNIFVSECAPFNMNKQIIIYLNKFSWEDHLRLCLCKMHQPDRKCV